jgi:sigma-B regulation protein RsbU (phosphoserine phosphatase)
VLAPARYDPPEQDDPPPLLSWRVTTRQAMTESVVEPFLAALRELMPACVLDEDAVVTALHEAVVNAAVHGNLGLAAEPESGLLAADALARRIEARLRNSARADLPVVITAMRRDATLMLSVRDEGAGFAVPANASADDAAPHGRGMLLMRAMASHVEYRRGGREVCLSFTLPQPAAEPPARPREERDELDFAAARILIADDSPTQRQMIAHCLREAGFGIFEFAADGQEALVRFTEFGPDLVLLDLSMPAMDGLEACRILSAREQRSVPILIQSATQTPRERVRAFEAGAVDFIVKPFYAPELVARVCTHLQNRHLVTRLRQFRERLSDELNAARLMQDSLMPSARTLDALRHSMGLDIAAHCEMSSELGGDIWGLRVIDSQRIGIYIADFTGHGVASAANAFRLHGVLGENGIRFERPDLVLQALNVRMSGVLPTGNFATMFYGVLDLAENRLSYAAAGATAPMLILPDGGVRAIDSSGLPVGLKPWHEYEVRSVAFPPGAELLLYSDALLEAPDDRDRTWDEEGLLSRLAEESRAASGAGDRIAALLAAFDAGRARPLPDDLTLVVLRRIIDFARASAA